MKKNVFGLLALSLFAAVASPAAVLDFATLLEPEAVGATGTGTASVRFDTVANTLRISTVFSGLSGTTTVAHIHCCVTPPGTVGVAVTPGTLPGFPVGVQSGDYTIELDLLNASTYTNGFLNNAVFGGGGTVVGARNALLVGLQSGTAYLNIHTSPTFGSGEIRGFLQPVPEPATFAFAGLALTGLLISRRYLSR